MRSERELGGNTIVAKSFWTLASVAVLFGVLQPGCDLTSLLGTPEVTGGSSNDTPTVTSSFSLTSEVGVDGGALPVDYTCDGAGYSPALSWSNPPAGTTEYALMMTTLPGDGTTKWSWVLYGIPASTTGLARNSTGVGISGMGSHGSTMAYEPPCSQGPGAKLYTFTVYANGTAACQPRS